ncbi:hypothetical protein PT974_05505 [Cladobotryum mycophilum]|uniref:Prion-inhibition and propagation HeLo domain-containing protein n=1 Tax=Cladobotryum mycophilum TaxID=491253 RepID=A0ABR0SIY7_9HYPO
MVEILIQEHQAWMRQPLDNRLQDHIRASLNSVNKAKKAIDRLRSKKKISFLNRTIVWPLKKRSFEEALEKARETRVVVGYQTTTNLEVTTTVMTDVVLNIDANLQNLSGEDGVLSNILQRLIAVGESSNQDATILEMRGDLDQLRGDLKETITSVVLSLLSNENDTPNYANNRILSPDEGIASNTNEMARNESDVIESEDNPLPSTDAELRDGSPRTRELASFSLGLACFECDSPEAQLNDTINLYGCFLNP